MNKSKERKVKKLKNGLPFEKDNHESMKMVRLAKLNEFGGGPIG